MTGPVIHRDIEQHSDDWYAMRSGKWTASSAAKVMSKIGPKGGMTLGLSDLIKSIAFARHFGFPDEPHYQSLAMERGNETEAEARDWYSFESGEAVEEVGFVEHGTVPHVGWSPDGLCIGKNKGVEVKCLLHKAWMDVKRTMEVPSEYRWQCRWAIWTGDLDGLDFIAYHPQAGGLIVPCRLTDSERTQMTERVALLEPQVQEWIDILSDAKQAA